MHSLKPTPLAALTTKATTAITRRNLLALTTATALLAACGRAEESSAMSHEEAYELLVMAGSGFDIGERNEGSQPIYVLFDAMCRHCARLWEASQPLTETHHFIWMPVALLGKHSRSVGASILFAHDPVAAMNQHKAWFGHGEAPLAAPEPTEEMLSLVDENTKLFKHFQAGGVPLVVADTGGPLIVHSGSMDTAGLRQLLGIAPPKVQV